MKRLIGAGLTNDPALYMRAIATAQSVDDREDPMDLEKLRKALGLSKDATEEQILAAASAAHGAATTLTALGATFGLGDTAKAEEIAAAAKAAVDGLAAIAKAVGAEEGAKPDAIATAVADTGGSADPTKFVPRAEFDRISQRLTELETSGAEEKAAAAVDAAIAAGKFPPATRDHYLAHAKRDLADFEKLSAATPAVLTPGAISANPPPDEGAPLTADELAICRATGVTEEQFRESRKALAARREVA